MSAAADTVSRYLRRLPPRHRAVLSRLRATILAAAPGAEESISYGMPAYKLNGALVYFAAFKDHCSFFPANRGTLAQFEKELLPFDTSGGTIRFLPDRPLPSSLVRRIVRARVRENAQRRAQKAARKRK
jgi:uncharacterized protein YdhG (YjbR/CyaY superfamily)